MRTFLIIVLITLILVLGFIQLRIIWNKIKFEFGISGIDILNIDLSNFLTGGNVMVPIRAKVINENSFSIPFKNLKAWLYYENTIIAQTSERLASKSFDVPANGSIDVVDPVNIYLNTASSNLLKSLTSNPIITYKVQLKIWWLPFSYTGDFIAKR